MTDNRQTDSTQSNTLAVPVVLRVWRDGGGVFALFPTLPSDEHGRYCDAYAHVGQHSGADYWGCVRASRPATAAEGAPLVRELERIGYRPRVVQRATAAMHGERKAEARRIREAMRAPRAG
jgi:hypothetical protein